MGDKNFEHGYQHGQDDAESGRGKSTFLRPIKRLLKPDSFFPGGGDRIDSYLKGYGTGFEDSVRVVNTSVQPENRMRNIMSTQSLAHQLELLDDLYNYLKSVQDQMDGIRKEYGTKVNDLRDAGMMIERHERLYRQVFNPTESVMLRFIEHLEERDLTVVRAVMQKVEHDLNDERSSGDY
jgi:archaellum component FlaC